MQVEVPTTLTTSPSARPRRSRPSARRTRRPGSGFRPQPELFRPLRREKSGDLVGGFVVAIELFAHPRQQRIDLDQKGFGRQAAEGAVPQPFVAHRADAAFRRARVGDAAQRRRDHVAMLERARELSSLVGIVPQPMQQLRESPFGGIHAAAPVDRREAFPMRDLGDLRRLALGAVVAPKVIIVERAHRRIDRHHARPGGVERDRGHLVAADAPPPSRPAASPARARACGRRATAWRSRDRPRCRCSGYSATAEPSRPRSLSTIETRTLSVPKSTPATMAMFTSPPNVRRRTISSLSVIAGLDPAIHDAGAAWIPGSSPRDDVRGECGAPAHPRCQCIGQPR